MSAFLKMSKTYYMCLDGKLGIAAVRSDIGDGSLIQFIGGVELRIPYPPSVSAEWIEENSDESFLSCKVREFPVERYSDIRVWFCIDANIPIAYLHPMGEETQVTFKHEGSGIFPHPVEHIMQTVTSIARGRRAKDNHSGILLRRNRDYPATAPNPGDTAPEKTTPGL